MRIQLISLACVTIFYGCAKENESQHDKDKKVVEIWRINSTGTSVDRSTVYKLKSSADDDTISVISIDTSFWPIGYFYRIQERQYLFDPGTKQLIKVTSRSLNDGRYNNSTAAVYDIVFDYQREGLNHSRFTVDIYSGSWIVGTQLFNNYLLGIDPPTGGYVYSTYPPGSGTVPKTITLVSKDDRTLGVTEEDVPSLNKHYFISNIPGYRYGNINMYYYHYDTENRCTAAEIENGFYEWIGNTRVFKPTARRKIHYRYNNDFSRFREAMSNIHLFEKSPWLRIAQWRSTAYESYDLYDLYNEASSSYTDSLFTFSNSGERTIVSGSTHTKEAEKDSQGNIVSIIERNTRNAYTVQYLLKY